MALSSSSLNRIEAAARRYARLLDDGHALATPATFGIDVTLGANGSIQGVTLGECGVPYEFDRLDAETITGAMLDAARIVQQGPRAWRRIG